jgi:hypothetical protein
MVPSRGKRPDNKSTSDRPQTGVSSVFDDGCRAPPGTLTESFVVLLIVDC